MRRKADLDARIEALGKVVVLPEDARQVLDRSRSRESEASARIDTLSGQLDAARKALEGLTYDEGLVLRADDVRQLHERRIETRSEKADLPKRRAELDAAERELRDLAAELGWRTDEAGALIDRIPARPRVGAVRSLLGRRGELSSEVSKSAEALEEARAERARLQERLDASGDAADTSRLDAVIRTLRESGDLTGRRDAATQGVKDARERVGRLLRSLHPGVSNDEDAAAMRVPARTEVQRHRDLVQDRERQTREIRQKIETAERDLARARKAYENAVRDGDVVPPDTLQAARAERDTLWERVKLRYVDNTPIPVEKAMTTPASRPAFRRRSSRRCAPPTRWPTAVSTTPKRLRIWRGGRAPSPRSKTTWPSCAHKRKRSRKRAGASAPNGMPCGPVRRSSLMRPMPCWNGWTNAAT